MKDKYKIKSKDIDKKIRLIGIMFRKFIPSFNLNLFKKSNKFMDKHIKHKWFDNKSKIEEITIKRNDNSTLRILLARHKKENNSNLKTCIMWIHGGGFSIGLPEECFNYAKLFLNDKDTIMVLPDYKKSLESPYPSSLKDCYLTLKWIVENSNSLGINKNQIFVGGESAGGGLAISLSLYLKDKSNIKIAGLFSLYPMISYFDTLSNKNNDSPIWNTKSNKVAWELYLKNIDKNNIPIYASPSLNKDFKDLPPLFSYIGTLDPFFDELMDYSSKLKKEGIEVKIKIFKGCYHAFDLFGYFTSIGKESRKYLKECYKYAKENYFTHFE